MNLTEKTRIYTLDVLTMNLNGCSTAKDIEDLVVWYLSKEANSKWLNRHLFNWSKSSRFTPSLILGSAKKAYKRVRRDWWDIANDSKDDPLGEVYDKSGIPLPADEGALEAALFLVLKNTMNYLVDRNDPKGASQKFSKNISLLLRHSSATMGLLYSCVRLAQNMDAASKVKFKIDTDFGDSIDEVLYHTLIKWRSTWSPREFAFGLADIWDEDRSDVFWSITDHALKYNITPVPEASIARIFTEIFNILDNGSKRHSAAAEKILKFAPTQQLQSHFETDCQGAQCKGGHSEEDIELYKQINHTSSHITSAVKEELPNYIAHQLIMRWLPFLGPSSRWHFLTNLGLIVKANQDWKLAVDERTHSLLEAILGPEGWKALCALQNEDLWEGSNEVPDDGVRNMGSLKTDSIEWQTVYEVLSKVDWQRHQHGSALEAETFVHESGVTGLESEKCKTEGLFLLSEGIRSADNYDAPRILHRSRTEFLGKQFSKISLSGARSNGYGAACDFELFVSDSASIVGHLDDNGSISFDNIFGLTTLTTEALEAVVIDSLCSILFPKYIEGTPSSNSNNGFRVLASSNPQAARPVVHTSSDLTLPNQRKGEEPLGTRINSQVVTWVFQSLLGDDVQKNFRLYEHGVSRLEGKRKSGRKERYFYMRHDARDLLVGGELGLGQVFLRIVRAHTQPTGIVEKDGGFTIRQMSDKARRHYDRFQKERGVELDLSSVQKTYILSTGETVVLDVPRTFNQGAFCSLAVLWEHIPDPELKSRAAETFRF